ncbi:nuclear transport factor 2 family protein [Rossellomorea marisflavi]|uniref:Nuclear transport factor 2 family protein n=1 Tax=Rossellomorea marisflavi TaxID=189381 RepID=A0A5D4RYY3_9BACI|nr:nuclear transport factor 2 family protein [Rossellomorea marisflavi]TYS54984.1 nuclear transport factor 2 family protein [Rossellomorea marisflavi]
MKNGTAKDVLEVYKTAVYEQDVEKFLSIHAENVHIYDCWGDWECRGISELRKNVTEWFTGLNAEGEILKVLFHEVKMEESETVAFVHCEVVFAAYTKESEEKLRQIANRFTFGLKKIEGSWVIAHQHSSLPIDMNTGKGMFHLR